MGIRKGGNRSDVEYFTAGNLDLVVLIQCPWIAQLTRLFGDEFCRLGREEERNVATLS